MKRAEPSRTSLTLLDAARQNDQQAWQRLCEIYSPLIYTWIRRAGLQESDAADLVQDVFRIVAGHLHKFRKDRPGDTFRGWLWTITRNELRGWFRKKNIRRDQAHGGTDGYHMIQAIPDWIAEDTTLDDIDPENSAESMIIRKAAELVRADFEPHTWQAFWRATVEGQPTKAIATDLRMTAGAVRQAKFRVLARLKEVLPA